MVRRGRREFFLTGCGLLVMERYGESAYYDKSLYIIDITFWNKKVLLDIY